MMPKIIAGRKRKLEDTTVTALDDLYPTNLPSFRHRRGERDLRVKENLCKRCAAIDFDALLSRQHKTSKGQFAKGLGLVANWKIESCLFCSLLHSTLHPNSAQPSQKHKLESFSTNKITGSVWRSIDTNLLEVNRSGVYIASQPRGIEGPIRILRDDFIEFSILKDWICFCQNVHTKVCSIETSQPVPYLKLIDCVTRTMVPALNHPYVALSYVWGQSSAAHGYVEVLPEDLPHTIEDSITVTKELGFRYLWIDRYCINQERKEEVSEQVQRMNLIYQNAEVTIIAAAGEDPTYGLPGVGHRKRDPRTSTACTKIGKHFLISAGVDPHWPIKLSTWRTRAWTYQEALLSRRRLVFTDHQVYYECNGMYCCEALNFPLRDLHRKDMQGFKAIIRKDQNVGVFPKGVGNRPLEVVKRIEEYTKLHLTNSSDILKGILGVLNAFGRGPLNLHHHLGVPILPQSAKKAWPIGEHWTSAMGFFSGLFWSLDKRSDRRVGFPSWSWTGWYGETVWGGVGNVDWPDIRVDPNVQMNVELTDGQVMEWDAFQESKGKPNIQSEASNVIHISVWTIAIRIIGCEHGKEKDVYKTEVRLEGGGYLHWRFPSISTVELLPDQLCTGVILAHTLNDLGPTGPAIMILHKVGDKMERIGFGWIDQWYYKRYDKDGIWEHANSKDRALWTNPDFLEPLILEKCWQEIRLG